MKTGLAYHSFSGIGRGRRLMRQGQFGPVDQWRPRMVPAMVRGIETRIQINSTEIMVPIGMAFMVL